MPGRTRTWSQGDSWSKLAYAYLGDSRKFRDILDFNESFDIRNKPAIGVPVFVTGPNGEKGKNTSSAPSGSPGTLNQLNTAINFNPTADANPEKVDIASAIFPWDTLDAFTKRLTEYTAYAALKRDRINGYGLDSPQASSDTQRG
jgi:hypothetical protein